MNLTAPRMLTFLLWLVLFGLALLSYRVRIDILPFFSSSQNVSFPVL